MGTSRGEKIYREYGIDRTPVATISELRNSTRAAAITETLRLRPNLPASARGRSSILPHAIQARRGPFALGPYETPKGGVGVDLRKRTDGMREL